VTREREADEPTTGRPLPVAFVIGCARSGTSILGELIASHPDVQYVFEAHDVWESVGTGPGGSHRLTADDATPAVRDRLRGWVRERLGGRRLFVEKTPRNVLRVPFLRAVFPEARLVHIVRDGRDVACSLRPGIAGGTWEHLKPPGWRELADRYEGVERCARAWRAVMETALDDLAGVPHLEVRYERLVARPAEVAAELLGHLGLGADPDVTAFCEKVRDETRGSYQARHQDRWYRDGHARRVGRWREDLDPGQQRVVNDVLGPVLDRLGYR
jgi:hypothetical protein